MLRHPCAFSAGGVVGLFAKDEKGATHGGMRNDFVRENPNMEEGGQRFVRSVLSPQRARFPE